MKGAPVSPKLRSRSRPATRGTVRAARAALVVSLLTVPALLLVTLLLPAACAPKNSLSGAGQECFAASDCEPGLVCVPQRNGGRICSSDLTQVTGRPPPEAGMAEAGDAMTDGPVVDAPVDDTGPADTGIKDAADAG